MRTLNCRPAIVAIGAVPSAPSARRIRASISVFGALPARFYTRWPGAQWFFDQGAHQSSAPLLHRRSYIPTSFRQVLRNNEGVGRGASHRMGYGFFAPKGIGFGTDMPAMPR